MDAPLRNGKVVCIALTKAGPRCKRTVAAPGARFCSQHEPLPLHNKSDLLSHRRQCSASNKTGARCMHKTLVGISFCHYHVKKMELNVPWQELFAALMNCCDELPHDPSLVAALKWVSQLAQEGVRSDHELSLWLQQDRTAAKAATLTKRFGAATTNWLLELHHRLSDERTNHALQLALSAE
jgi:hypothetical protein